MAIFSPNMSARSVARGVYLVTDHDTAHAAGHRVVDVARAAAAAGVQYVQVRCKRESAREFLQLVGEVTAAVAGTSAGVIVNDRVDVFLAARAQGWPVAGVHVGQTDLPPEHVRALVGRQALIGLSVSAHHHARDVLREVVDYVGVGAYASTSTKADASAPHGLSGLRRLARSACVPAFAIGGITSADIPDLARAGMHGVAVSSLICGSAYPAESAAAAVAMWTTSSS